MNLLEMYLSQTLQGAAWATTLNEVRMVLTKYQEFRFAHQTMNVILQRRQWYNDYPQVNKDKWKIHQCTMQADFLIHHPKNQQYLGGYSITENPWGKTYN